MAGIALIAMPVAFNVSFALLGARFDYPDILRRPTEEILERFRAGGPRNVLDPEASASIFPADDDLP